MFQVMDPFPEDVALPRLSKVTTAFTSERRKWPRAHVHWPVEFFVRDGEPIECTTRNVSSGGFYAVTGWRSSDGDCLDCILSVPAHRSTAAHELLRIYCRVEVVRVDDLAEHLFGIACRILHYRVSAAY